ncbi:MAG: septum formation initiator family protein [Deltaproteobacteria bacterium]|nr:septum formation initiator family protein [Deltaproteobacteria bacterium]
MSRISKIKRKGSFIFLLGIILVVWFFTLFGEKGIVKIIQLRRERDRIIADVNRIQEDNKRLQEEIRRLREDSRYLESVARRDLGLIKENEILFIFEDAGKVQNEKKD